MACPRHAGDWPNCAMQPLTASRLHTAEPTCARPFMGSILQRCLSRQMLNNHPSGLMALPPLEPLLLPAAW